MKIALAFLLCLFVCSCGEDAPAPTCSEAMNSFYAQGCSFYTEDGPTSLTDSILGCNQTMVEASARGGSCPSKMNAMLRCLDGVSGAAECETCNDELGTLSACH